MQGRSFLMLALLSVTRPGLAIECIAVDGTDKRGQIDRILSLASEPSARNLQAVERYYRSLPDESRNDRRLKYAYAVALIQQRRLHDAARLLDELAPATPESFGILRTKIWVELALNERCRALADIEQLVVRAAPPQDSGAERLSDPDLAGFLGTVSGLLRGPWSEESHPRDVRQIRDRWRGVFDDQSQIAFDRSSKKVIDRFAELRRAHEERAPNELESNAMQLDEARRALVHTGQELGAKRRAIEAKVANRAADARAKIADIDDRLRKVEDERTAILWRMAPLEAARLELLGQMWPEPVSKSPSFATTQYNRPIRLMLASLVPNVSSMEAGATILTQREQELLTERAATCIKFNVELGKFAQQGRALEQDRKRLTSDGKTLNFTPAAHSPTFWAEAKRLTSLSAYWPFPFEAEKTRLLEEAQR